MFRSVLAFRAAFAEEFDRLFSLRMGSFGNCVLAFPGIGTVRDLLLEIVWDAWTTLGEAEDHERGVVAVVDPLQGLEVVVS